MSLKGKKAELRRKRQAVRDRLKQRTGNKDETDSASGPSDQYAGPEQARVEPVVFACVQCSGAIRISVPAPAESFRCPRCRLGYRISTLRTEPLVCLLVPDGTASDRKPADRPKRSVPEHIRVAFTVLGLEPTADLASVRREYRQLIRQYHPDKVATLGPDIRRVAEAKTRDLNRAYEVIADFLSPLGQSARP